MQTSRSHQIALSLGLLLALSTTLQYCTPTGSLTSPGKLQLSVTNKKLTIVSDMVITGKNFTPNKQVTVTITNFPRKAGNITLNITADASGNFTRHNDFSFLTVGRNEEFINILVSARDEATTNVTITNVSPEPYLIRI
jgi:hypothetical protein